MVGVYVVVVFVVGVVPLCFDFSAFSCAYGGVC